MFDDWSDGLLFAKDDTKVYWHTNKYFLNDKWISFVIKDRDAVLKEAKNEMNAEEINDQDVYTYIIHIITMLHVTRKLK